MPVTDLPSWFEEHAVEGKIWLVKRLSANDTGLTGSHQAGPLIPKSLLFQLFPSLNDRGLKAPTAILTVYADSHAQLYEDARAKWYWSKNEGRFTRVGGESGPFLDKENTGAIAVFVFDESDTAQQRTCHAWVCEGNGTEDDFIEESLGPIEPKRFLIWYPGKLPKQSELFDPNANQYRGCYLTAHELPPKWLIKFPTGLEIIQKVTKLKTLPSLNVDLRLQQRRDCEFELFRSIEDHHFLPKIGYGFNNIEDFLSVSHSILQSRKSRAGKSLEYHVKMILEEEDFSEGIEFSHNPISESNKRPDFLFPSVDAYQNPKFPQDKLRMLACKTTCKDRWRQIINEADRIEIKHLLTLQEGVSENQFREMHSHGVRLVVPKKLHTKYPQAIRSSLMSLEDFLAELREIRP